MPARRDPATLAPALLDVVALRLTLRDVVALVLTLLGLLADPQPAVTNTPHTTAAAIGTR